VLAYYRSCDYCCLCQEHNNVLRLHEFLRCFRLEFQQFQAQLLAHSPLPTMVEAVTLAWVEGIHLCGVLSSSATVLATMTGSTTSTLAPATPSTPTSAGPMTQGGTTASTASPRLMRLSSVEGVPPTARGARVPLPVLVVLLLSSLHSGSLSSPGGWIVWSIVSPSRSIHGFFCHCSVSSASTVRYLATLDP
jgi:hypothetical protein